MQPGKILELEDRCTGNRTWVRIPPSPPCPIDLQGFSGLFDFQSINAPT